MNKVKAEALDKYYTKSEIAKQCFEQLKTYLNTRNDLNSIVLVEPSAGNGRFYDVMTGNKVGLDIAPERADIIKSDFLSGTINEYCHKSKQHDFIFLGNPPFGKKSKLAIDFVNTSLDCGKVVGFIVPIQFRKWSVQSKIQPAAKLVLDITLPEASFTLLDKDYKLRCCFQIWALEDTTSNDLRMPQKPTTKHQDFVMYQYNRTEEAKKYFDYSWDFAVPRQGYLDYTYKAYSKYECNEKQQWIFFKANTQEALAKLHNLDFVKLSHKNTGLPGFGMADVIEEYNKL